jgi:hypothetical protein
MKQTRAENEERERDEERAKPRRSRWPLFVVLAILLIGAVLAGLYCWQMWWRFDDEADMRGEWKAVGFVYANNGTHHNLNYYCRTVDDVERLTGLDFFCQLPDDVENQIEKEIDWEAWRIRQ